MAGLCPEPKYLFAGGEMIGMRIDFSDETTYTRYLHKDHLGSIATITNRGSCRTPLLRRLRQTAASERG
jgi:hypothetical protein